MAQTVLEPIITTGDTVGTKTSISQLTLFRLQSLRGQGIIEERERNNESGSNSDDTLDDE